MHRAEPKCSKREIEVQPCIDKDNPLQDVTSRTRSSGSVIPTDISFPSCHYLSSVQVMPFIVSPSCPMSCPRHVCLSLSLSYHLPILALSLTKALYSFSLSSCALPLCSCDPHTDCCPSPPMSLPCSSIRSETLSLSLSLSLPRRCSLSLNLFLDPTCP